MRQKEAGKATAPRLPEKPWAAGRKELLDALEVSGESGLKEDEARRRIEDYGHNRLREARRRSIWNILYDQVKSLVVLLLVVALVVSLVFGQVVEAVAIGVVIVINTAIGFFTEWRAVRSMEALQKLGNVEARVRREGEDRRIPAEELVPGDLLLLESGDVVAADVRLLDVSKLQANESALTGESVPVAKQTEPVEDEAPLAERASMVFKGTAITRGSGEGVVVATGMQTEVGEISALVEQAGAEETPLERKVDQLGRRLVWLTLAVAAAVMVAGAIAGRDLFLMVETGIALAVAAVPEGLPIVATIALARGMWRMVQRDALVRRLSSVETLGSTGVICTDKTGTLTENRMTARELALPSGTASIEPSEEEGEATFRLDDRLADPQEDAELRRAIEVAVLCNGASLPEDKEEEAEGDPMEVALLEMGRRVGLRRSWLVERMPQARTVAFDRETKMMATYHESEDGFLVAVKGAPEVVLDSSTRVLGKEVERPLDEEGRQFWGEQNSRMAEEGLRVLALARKRVEDAEAEPYEDLWLLGLVGLLDPPREGVAEAIDRCQHAGIRVVMMTGDHPATARNIAASVGLADQEEDEVIRGADFVDPEEASESERARMLNASIFARVSPEQKLGLIGLHQDNGAVVAVTGDGVNDAPALREADIGVAMGERGTEVAREAADMVLLDDAFPTIVAAVEQGRIIFANIRKFVLYLLSGNVGEILAVGAAVVAGAPLPLLPLQILYLNMINDVFPALALGVGRGGRRVMDRPPRDPKEPILGRYRWGLIGGYGVLIAATILGAFVLAGPGANYTQAVTVAFLTLSISRLLHVFNMRNPGSGLFYNEITRNPFVWGAIALSVGLLLLAVYVPPLARVLGVTDPGLRGWLLVAGASLVPLVGGQLYLLLSARGDR